MARTPLAPSTSQVAAQFADQTPPGVTVDDPTDAPVKKLDPQELMLLGQKFNFLFMQYVSDRRIAELLGSTIASRKVGMTEAVMYTIGV